MTKVKTIVKSSNKLDDSDITRAKKALDKNSKANLKLALSKSKKNKGYITDRKKRLRKIVAEKIRKGSRFTRYKTMIEAGYSKTTASTANASIKKPWKELMNEFFPDDVLAEVEREQLHATHIAHYVFPLTYTDEDILDVVEAYPNCHVIRIEHGVMNNRAFFQSPDNLAVAKALDRAYKLKGHYAAEKIQLTDPREEMTSEELDEELERLEKEKSERLKMYLKKTGKQSATKK